MGGRQKRRLPPRPVTLSPASPLCRRRLLSRPPDRSAWCWDYKFDLLVARFLRCIGLPAVQNKSKQLEKAIVAGKV
jgi:hypothetical protein